MCACVLLQRLGEGAVVKVELLLCTCCEPFWNLGARETPKM